MAGRGRPPKWPATTMELAEYLFNRTPISGDEAARLVGVPARTLKDWWGRLPTPLHRGGKGVPAKDVALALTARIEELEAELEKRNKLIEETTGMDPKSTTSLIDLARLRLQEALGVGCSAKLGEIAAALRALVDVREKEIEASAMERVRVAYYMPGGSCPHCGGDAPRIRPEDLFAQAEAAKDAPPPPAPVN